MRSSSLTGWSVYSRTFRWDVIAFQVSMWWAPRLGWLSVEIGRSPSSTNSFKKAGSIDRYSLFERNSPKSTPGLV